MSRLPIRVRMTIVFALATALVLALAGSFVYLRVEAELNNSVDDALLNRVDELARSLDSPGRLRIGGARAEGNEDTLAEVLGARGNVVASSELRGKVPALDPAQLATLTGPTLFSLDSVAGIDGGARILARPYQQGTRTLYLLTGASTGDRNETLSRLARTFAIGVPLSLLAASILGYAVATIAIRPMERMRSRAAQITLDRTGQRLPLPDTADEIHRLGQTLNEMLERIEGSIVRERGFVADASHELRTPLAIIRSELELGLEAGASRQELVDGMRSAAEEVTRMQTLTDELLELSSSEQSVARPLELEVVELARLLGDLEARYESRFGRAGRSIELAVDPSLEVALDAGRVASALSNLVDNALRYGAGTVRVSAARDRGELVLAVADQGAGFPAGFAQRAFDRFSRGDAGRGGQGTGLGLALVRAVAEAHGGSAAIVESGPGTAGATVELRIPDAPAPGTALATRSVLPEQLDRSQPT